MTSGEHSPGSAVGTKKGNREKMKTNKPDKVPSGISVQEAGRRGGLKTSALYRSTGFYRKIGTRGGETTKTRWGHLFSEFGRRGGRPRRPNLENGVGEGSPQKREDAVGPGDASPT